VRAHAAIPHGAPVEVEVSEREARPVVASRRQPWPVERSRGEGFIVLRHRLLPLVAALLVGGLLVLPSADAGQLQVTVSGTVDCDIDEGGFQIVEWTVENNLGIAITIVSAVGTDSGLTVGSAIDTPVTVTPNPLTSGASATGFGTATGDATGDFHLIVTYSFDGTFEADGEVVLPGGCEAPETTTTTSTTSVPTTSTTVPEPEGAGAVPIQPTFTG